MDSRRPRLPSGREWITDVNPASFPNPLCNRGWFSMKGYDVLIAGLTGGIASGKSTISGYFADAGAYIIDADTIARAVVKKGMPAYDEICSYFGATILAPDGEIDRKRLGAIIFNATDKKMRLNAIVHPHVFKRMKAETATIARQHPEAVIILDIPLLFETGMDRDLAEVIVVFIPESIQLQRLIERDRIDQKAAMARIRSQLPIGEKRRRATIVIDNSGSPSASRRQTQDVYARLKRMAAN
jgi:dephospho-CoA kinase